MSNEPNFSFSSSDDDSEIGDLLIEYVIQNTQKILNRRKCSSRSEHPEDSSECEEEEEEYDTDAEEEEGAYEYEDEEEENENAEDEESEEDAEHQKPKKKVGSEASVKLKEIESDEVSSQKKITTRHGIHKRLISKEMDSTVDLQKRKKSV